MMVRATIESNRMKELMSILEDIDGKAIIWANYQRDIKVIVDNIGKKVW